MARPTKYKKEYCKQLIEHMTKGLSFESFAGVLQVSNKTLYTWAEKNPEFLHAKKVGTDKSRLFWEKLGVAGAAGKIPNFGSASYIFNMKNRFKWRDKQPDEDSVNVTVNLGDKLAKARERAKKGK